MVSAALPAGTARRGWHAAVALCAALAALNLVFGLAGGMARLGLPGPTGPALAFHGVLMVSGFFGSLISLERAVALRQPLGLLVPLLAAVGGLLAWGGAAIELPLWLWLAAALGLLGLYAWAGSTRAWSLPMAIEMLGAACWCLGLVLWLQGGLAHEALPAWMGFLLLTIAGERRELMNFVHLSPMARRWFGLGVGLVPAAVVLALVNTAFELPQWAWVDTPMLLFWIGGTLLALWLLAHDFAPRQWSAPEWRGLTAQALTLGYVWLLVGGLLGSLGRWLFMASAGPAWHALLLGFVFSMVFGHAPIILPALTGVRPRYAAWLRWPAWLLSASLLLRIAATGFQHPVLLATAGAGHALAIAWFAIGMLRAALQGRHPG